MVNIIGCSNTFIYGVNNLFPGYVLKRWLRWLVCVTVPSTSIGRVTGHRIAKKRPTMIKAIGPRIQQLAIHLLQSVLCCSNIYMCINLSNELTAFDRCIIQASSYKNYVILLFMLYSQIFFFLLYALNFLSIYFSNTEGCNLIHVPLRHGVGYTTLKSINL